MLAPNTQLPPRNVAFLWQQIPVGSAIPEQGVTVAEGSDGQPIVAQPLLPGPSRNGSYLVRPSEPLPENARFWPYRHGSPDGQNQTGDYLDETPPERPVVASGELSFHDGTQGCTQNSCGDYTSLRFELERRVSDDHALSDDMVYVVYLGESEAQVLDEVAPFAYVLDFTLIVDNGWSDKDAFIAVSALDHSGNESERSEAFRVNAASSEGCSVKSRSTRQVSGSVFLLAFAFALLRRMRRR